ncbi:MAG TPA: hypothetical protein VL225_08525 [Vicinamibacterales bacterium]|jgi:hypothetical protein|nr:hypothetical protein [Vicinamibacterales bacterium]
MSADLPRPARLLARLIPRADRESIVGDLLEDAAFRDLEGRRRDWWLAAHGGAIGVGFTLQRAWQWVALPPLNEVAAGVLVDGRGAFRGHPGAVVVRALLLCGSIATIALGVEVLVSSLLSAAGL